jgi:hypothetical protein
MDKRLMHLKALSRRAIVQLATTRETVRDVESVASMFVKMVMKKDVSFSNIFNFVITEIDGYGDDPFLKRAILLFLQLNRILGLFEKETKLLPIPADYQVPNMLRYYGILQYCTELEDVVDNGVHVLENTPEEASIRAGAIIAADKLGKMLGWPASDVDGWFFIRRKDATTPFHLTITSNY